MSSWAIIAIVAIVVWGIVSLAKARAGIISDEDGNETYIGPREDTETKAALEDARQEMSELRERVQILERIATDNNSLDARERARITAEIEALRTPSETAIPATPSLSKEDQSS